MVIIKQPSAEERCKRNIRCWFVATGGPTPTFLTEQRRLELHILLPVSTPSRSYIECDGKIYAHLQNMSRGKWMLGTGRKDHCPCGSKTAFDGGREHSQIRYALQWILHQSLVTSAQFFEIDFDGWNPNEGAAPAIAHFLAEWLPHKLFGKSTDPYKVARYRGWEVAENG